MVPRLLARAENYASLLRAENALAADSFLAEDPAR
jgi:hypothetical protein